MRRPGIHRYHAVRDLTQCKQPRQWQRCYDNLGKTRDALNLTQQGQLQLSSAEHELHQRQTFLNEAKQFGPFRDRPRFVVDPTLFAKAADAYFAGFRVGLGQSAARTNRLI